MNLLSPYVARMGTSVSSTCVNFSSRVAHNYRNQQYPAIIIPLVGADDVVSSRRFSTSNESKKGKKGKTDEDATAATQLSYFERKAALKQQRIQYFQQKLQRTVRLKHRRDGAPKDVLKNEFKSWWDMRRINEERMERKARQAGMEWKIQVATIVERLPIVLPDKMVFETEYENLQAYLKSHSGKDYPVEFTGTGGSNRPVALTDEELIGRWRSVIIVVGRPLNEPRSRVPLHACSPSLTLSTMPFLLCLTALLPENYKPAPRETKADLDGSVDTLDRRLKERVYLMVGDSFPTTEVAPEGSDKEESLLEAALRGLGEHISTTGKSRQKRGDSMVSGSSKSNLPLDLYCPSQSPLAVKLDTFDTDKQASAGYFGTKTFFVKVQYDDGKIIGNTNIDFAWLDRSEIVERVTASFGEEEAKFYKYML
jgi:hypothetical protein